MSSVSTSVSSKARRAISYLFGLREPVSRKQYAIIGFSLMTLKYLVDATAVYAWTGRFWSPLSYLAPFLTLHLDVLGQKGWIALAMAIWTLPFLWIGLSLTFRRAIDAGLPRWWGLLFLVPIVNYLVMLDLCLRPSRPDSRVASAAKAADRRIESALLGLAGGLAFAVLVTALSVYVFRTYGSALFLGMPVVMGAVSSYLWNRGGPRSVVGTIGVSLLTVLLASLGFLLFALEGIVCLLMAAPIALPGAILGGLLGRALAGGAPPRISHAAMVFLGVPLLATLESVPRTSPSLQVTTAVEVDAPPGRVWENVIRFSPLPPPTELLFQVGVAFPQRAWIDGQGVGAIRHCEFSTGSFVEPITGWEPPIRLGFDVASQPPPMNEWNPYRQIMPPHLDHHFRSRRGEFRLTPLSGARTRLEGTTWYELDFFPLPYWKLWADWIVHSIHRRVLEHIKFASES